MGVSNKDNSELLDSLLSAFCEEQQEAEKEKEKIREEERRYEEEQRKIKQEYEDRQKTAIGRNNAKENIAKLKSLAQKRELAGININVKEYRIREKSISISEDLIEKSKINKLFSDKIRQLASKLFLSDAVKINIVEDITEKFFPAVREQILELCLYYQMLCQKLELEDSTLEEVYKVFVSEWFDEDFISEYVSIFEEIMESVATAASETKDTGFNPNITFDLNAMVKYSVLYQGSISGMLKTDVMNAAQSALVSLGNWTANGYQRFTLNLKLKKCAEQLQNVVKRFDRHIAMWGWEMQSDIILLLQKKGLMKESVDEIMSVDAVATYIMDDMETDKHLSENEIDKLCDLMLSGDPANPFVLYLFLRRLPKTDIDEFLRLIDDTGCNNSLIIALDMYCHIEKKFLKKDLDDILAMSSEKMEISFNYFSGLLGKAIKGTFVWEFLNSICIEIRKAISQKKKEEVDKKIKERRHRELAKKVFAFTPKEEITREYLEKQIDYISEVRAEICDTNTSWIVNHYKNEFVFQFTWQVSNRNIIKTINKYNIGNEYIFVYCDKFFITDKAWYVMEKNQEELKRQAYSDIDEIMRVSTYETFLNRSCDALLIRKDEKFSLEFMYSDYYLAQVVLSIISRVLLRSENFQLHLYDCDFVYCKNCGNLQIIDPKILKKCSACNSKIKEVGWMHEKYDGWDKLSDKLLKAKQRYSSELLQDIEFIYPEVKALESNYKEMKCKNCGTEFQEGIFCPECGTKFQEKIFCPECGSELLGRNFCTECGARIRRSISTSVSD